MKTKPVLLFLFFVSIAISSSAQYIKLFDTEADDEGVVIAQISNNGFLLAGNTSRESAVDDDIFVARFNAAGEIVWQKILSTSYIDNPACIIEDINQTYDTSYIIAGTTNGDICLINLNSDGSIAWAKQYGGSGIEQAKTVVENPDDGYTILGSSTSFSATPWDIYVIHTDVSGNPVWSVCYDTGNQDQPNSMELHQLPSSDYEFIITGTTRWDSIGDNDNDAFFLKLGITGDFKSFKTYPQYGYDEGTQVRNARIGSGFFIGGMGGSYCPGCIFIGRIVDNGDLTWVKSIDVGFDNNYIKFDVSPNNEIFLCGVIDDSTTSSKDILLLKLDSAANFQWARHYDASYMSAADDYMSQVSYLNGVDPIAITGTSTLKMTGNTPRIILINTGNAPSDICSEGSLSYTTNNHSILATNVTINDIAMTGETSSDAPFTVLEITPELNNYCFASGIESFSNDKPEMRIFPNPASNFITIEGVGLPTDKDFEVSVFCSTGKLIYHNPHAKTELPLDVSMWSNGVYIVSVKIKNQNTYLKFIKI